MDSAVLKTVVRRSIGSGGFDSHSLPSARLEDMIMTRIFVLCNQSVFSRGVEILLRQDKGVELVGEEANVERAIERVRVLCPDVVLVEQEPPACDPALVVMRILEELPGAEVVRLNLNDNTIRVYRGQQRIARDIGDLLEVIKNAPCREETAGP